MGRFRAEAVIIRRVDDLCIVFYDKKSIYVKDDKNGWTVFHRWFAPLGSYGGGWRQFRNRLLYNKNITFRECYKLAFQRDIASKANVKGPDLSKVKTVERFN